MFITIQSSIWCKDSSLEVKGYKISFYQIFFSADSAVLDLLKSIPVICLKWEALCVNYFRPDIMLIFYNHCPNLETLRILSVPVQ